MRREDDCNSPSMRYAGRWHPASSATLPPSPEGVSAVPARWITACLLLLGSLGVLPAAEPAAKVRQKLYVTNSAGDDVTIIDVATNKAIGRIEVGPHPHGIAVPAAQDVVYIT